MKRAGKLGCPTGQIVFYKPRGAEIFESRLILGHVDNDEYVSLSPAGGGTIVLDDLGAQGSFLEFSDPDKPAIRFEILEGLLDFDELPSQSEFEDLIERAKILAGKARDGRAAALAADKDGAPSSDLKRPYADYSAPAPRFDPSRKKPKVTEILVNPNLHVDNIESGSSGARASGWSSAVRLPAGGECHSCKAYNSSSNDICGQCGVTLIAPGALDLRLFFREPPGIPGTLFNHCIGKKHC
jgi:hypothetical protein